MPHRPTYALLGLLAFAPLAQAQHNHLNAGATGTTQGAKLTFDNADDFGTSSGYSKSLTFADSGVYAGFYQGNVTFTVLPTTVDNGGPVANAPAPGSFIRVGITSVNGPAGGKFAFWEEDATAPTYSFGVGYDAPSPTKLWDLSDASLGAGTAGADPFGHLHGRNFSATVAGDYVIGFRLFDTSENGAGGGPIHNPSDPLFIKFAAVPEPGTTGLMLLGAALLWRHTRRNHR